MCNASKHSPGCGCGFGPPYSRGYSVGDVTEWAEEVVDDPSLMRRGLRESGWDHASIAQFAKRLSMSTHANLPRATLVHEIREALGKRRRVVERTWTETVEVPLYRFGAPPVAGSKVEYSEGDTVGAGSGWKVRFFGVGTASTASVELTKSCTFVATAGTWKQVFVPVQVEVSLVALYENGVLVGRGHEAHAVSPRADDRLLHKRGVRSVRVPQLTDPADTNGPHDVLDLALASDTSGVIHKAKCEWVKDVTREISVELGKLIDVSAAVKVKRTRRLVLNFELPSGHNYLAHLCAGYTRWESPTVTAKQKAVRRHTGEATA